MDIFSCEEMIFLIINYIMEYLTKYSIFELISPGIIFGSVPLYLYDTMYEGKDMYKALYDSTLLFGSLFSTQIVSKILTSKVFDQF